MPNRTPFNRALLATHIILALVIPAVLLIANLNGMVTGLPDHFRGVLRLIFCFVSLPVYSVYAGLLLKEYFPRKNLQAIPLFLPYFLIGAFLLPSSQEHFFDSLFLFSLPFYLGLNLCFFAGLLYLIFTRLREDPPHTILLKLLVTILLICLFFTPPFFFSVFGWQLDQEIAQTPLDKTLAAARYIVSVILVIVAHHKLLIQLYRQGKL